MVPCTQAPSLFFVSIHTFLQESQCFVYRCASHRVILYCFEGWSVSSYFRHSLSGLIEGFFSPHLCVTLEHQKLFLQTFLISQGMLTSQRNSSQQQIPLFLFPKNDIIQKERVPNNRAALQYCFIGCSGGEEHPLVLKTSKVWLTESTYPASISKTRMPRAHQSTARPWPLLWITSGARYSGVPHRVQVLIRRRRSEAVILNSSAYCNWLVWL